MEHGIRFAAVVVLAVAASLAFSGPRLSGSVMFAGRVPWDALSVLVVVMSVYVGAVHAAPAWSSVVVALVGLGLPRARVDEPAPSVRGCRPAACRGGRCRFAGWSWIVSPGRSVNGGVPGITSGGGRVLAGRPDRRRAPRERGRWGAARAPTAGGARRYGQRSSVTM